MDNGRIQVAVLAGGHPYDAVSFNKLFGSIPGVEYYVQAIEGFCTDAGSCADKYDVILFYNMTINTPQDEEAWNVVWKKTFGGDCRKGTGNICTAPCNAGLSRVGFLG